MKRHLSPSSFGIYSSKEDNNLCGRPVVNEYSRKLCPVWLTPIRCYTFLNRFKKIPLLKLKENTKTPGSFFKYNNNNSLSTTI